jgi:predicted nucleic acid-binding protein
VTAYFDTSAAVKLVVTEPGSSEAQRIWRDARRVVSSVLMYPESRAALKKARRERRLTDVELQLAITEFEGLWAQVDRVAVSTVLATRAGVLAHDHDLRGYDAVHLAAAERIAWPDVVFVGADRDLCDAAHQLGLAVARLPRR